MAPLRFEVRIEVRSTASDWDSDWGWNQGDDGKDQDGRRTQMSCRTFTLRIRARLHRPDPQM